MTSDVDDCRRRVLFHYQACRATPGAPFDAARFLDHLMKNPAGDRAAHNSFAGLRRLSRQIEGHPPVSGRAPDRRQ